MQSGSPPHPQPGRTLGSRYEIVSLLGRGGMGAVYRVRDLVRDRQLALKQLLVGHAAQVANDVTARFEREFRVLRELAHPRIIQVYDYGLDAAGPFYTMELLDGGDLLGRAPLPWRDACSLMHDVCSSLALLHSRELVHCDITPRNIRCTLDGRAKLIDFGAMVPFGRSRIAVGTPSFSAPEIVRRGHLDAATDLYSLGASLYYALTRKPPYVASEFDALKNAWQRRPVPLAALVKDIPGALDDLVQSLLSLATEGRPRSAFEVMERLAAVAGIAQDITLDPAAVYLGAPRLVGRQRLLASIRNQLDRALAGEGGAVVVRGVPGVGRTRLLDAIEIECRLRGICALRADAAEATDFALANTLAEQLLEGLPETANDAARRAQVSEILLESSADAGPVTLRACSAREGCQDALHRWFLAVSEERPIALLVDDLQRIDAASAGLLAQCATRSAGRRMCIVLTMQSESNTRLAREVEVLLRNARSFEVPLMTEAETAELMLSCFGDVPNVQIIAHIVHAVSAGNPGLSVELSRDLVHRDLARYENGSWTLPKGVATKDLPESAEVALRGRVAELRPLAKRILETQALASYSRWRREDYGVVAPDASALALDQALRELRANGFLATHGDTYYLSHPRWAHVLTAHMTATEMRARHAVIASLYGDSMKSVFHLFEAGHDERGLDLMLRRMRELGDELTIFEQVDINAWEIGRLCERALETAGKPQRSARDAYDLLRWLIGLGVVADDAYYRRAAPRLLPLLKVASGLSEYARTSQSEDSAARLVAALRTTFEHFERAAEIERLCSPVEAIRHLATFVATSIPIAARTGDLPLLESLPGLLKPFVPLSPAVGVIYENALATCMLCVEGRVEDAHLAWRAIHSNLAQQEDAGLQYLSIIRDSILVCIATLEVQLGLSAANRWVERIPSRSLQASMALELYRLIALQHGDWEDAESFRKQAEFVSLQSRVRLMFSNLLWTELEILGLAGDLAGIRDVKERIDHIEVQSSLWRAARLLADAVYLLVSGRLDVASSTFEQCIGLCEPSVNDRTRPVQLWPIAMAFHLETLIDLGHAERAVVEGEAALQRCDQRGIAGATHGIVRGLGLAYGRLGHFIEAADQLDTHIGDLESRGVCGLQLGAMYEARARVAIWSGEAERFEHFRSLVAREYNCKRRSPLSIRYAALVAEARQRFSEQPPAPTLLRDAMTREERAHAVLSLLCDAHNGTQGHLYLTSQIGLKLAASRESNKVTPELDECVRHAFAKELSVLTDDAATLVETTKMSAPLLPDPDWVLIPLFFPTPTGILLVGMAVVLNGTMRKSAGSPELARALATELWRAGDIEVQSSMYER